MFNRVFLILALALPHLAQAHTYGSSSQPCERLGGRMVNNAHGSPATVTTWQYGSPDVTVCAVSTNPTGAAVANAPYAIPSATSSWLGSSTVGAHNFNPLNKNGVPYAHCGGNWRRCAAGTRFASGGGNNGQCIACDDPCDEDHVHQLAPPGSETLYQCVDKPENECPEGEEYHHETGQCVPECPAGEVWDTEQSLCVSECPAGQEYDPIFSQCMVDCPDLQEADPFDPTNPAKCGQPLCADEPGTIPWAPLGWDSPVSFYNCVPAPGQSENQCENGEETAGFIGGSPVCQDELDDCENAGGTVSMVNGDQTCIPADSEIPPPPTIPQCGSTEILTYTPSNTGNPWSCEKLQEKPPDMPEPEDPECGDIDDDGICNSDDGDIDGDGDPNSTDPDDDGDGVDDDDDGNPSGPPGDDGEGGENSVGGGGNCDAEPECKGDAVQCAIVYQTFATRCETLRGETEDELASLIEEDTVESLVQPDTDLTSTLTGVYNQTGGGGVCPAPGSFTVAGYAIELNYQPICDFAEMMRPFVIMMFGLATFLIMMRAF